MSIHVGFTGTRHGLTAPQYMAVRDALCRLMPDEFHHGDCVGADAQAVKIVRELFPKCRIVCHPPTNGKLRAFVASDVLRHAAPYLERNRNIVKASDVMVAAPAFEGGRGTEYTIKFAGVEGVPTCVCAYEGSRGLSNWKPELPQLK